MSGKDKEPMLLANLQQTLQQQNVAMQGLGDVLDKILEQTLNMVAEQERLTLLTMTLERSRLISALWKANLGNPVVGMTEFNLAPGATLTVTQLVPQGFVYLFAGPSDWYTSLPWWLSYSTWVDTTTPATPLATATRMPDHLTLDWDPGFVPARNFIVHTVTNLHVANTGYALVKNVLFSVTNETYEMIRSIWLDGIMKAVKDEAERLSGMPR